MEAKKFEKIYPKIKGKTCFVSIDVPLPAKWQYKASAIKTKVITVTGYFKVRLYAKHVLLLQIEPEEVFKVKINVEGFSYLENFGISYLFRGALLDCSLRKVRLENLKYLSFITPAGGADAIAGEKLEIY